MLPLISLIMLDCGKSPHGGQVIQVRYGQAEDAMFVTTLGEQHDIALFHKDRANNECMFTLYLSY